MRPTELFDHNQETGLLTGIYVGDEHIGSYRNYGEDGVEVFDDAYGNILVGVLADEDAAETTLFDRWYMKRQSNGGASTLREEPDLQGDGQLTHDKAMASTFLTHLDPTATRFTFQTFDDNKDRKSKALARVLHGTLDVCFAELTHLNNLGAGIFITVNETNFLGRSAKNIVRPRALFHDADGDEQVTRATTVIEAHDAIPSMTVRSGGGRHGYYICDDIPLDQFSALQKSLAAKLGTDPAVHDLPRVMRLPGMLHLKDPSKPRLVKLVATGGAVRRWKLSDLIDRLGLSTTTSDRTSGGHKIAEAFRHLDPNQRLAEGIEYPAADIEEIRSAALAIPPAVITDEPNWMSFARALAWQAKQRPDDTEVLWEILDTVSRQAPKYNEDDNRAKFDRYIDEAGTGVKTNTIATLFFLAREHGWRAKAGGERHTDLGNARRLVRLHGDDIRYVPAWKSWLVWRDGHWRRDDDGEIMRLAKATVEGMYAEAAGIAESERTALRKHALKCQSAQRLAAMVELAKTEKEVVLPVSMIDTDPLLLGVENGVIDLRTGRFRPAEREDYVTKRCGTAFDPSATCPNWDAFLQRIFPNNQILINYVQRACGYTLTGLTDEEVMFILWATGANGKSTLRETIFALMGDYAMGADASLLIAHKKQQGGGATPDVARLHGKRLVTINETQEGDHLNESRVKFITSHDITTARFLYENLFDFTPTHKTWLTTNKKPIIKGTDLGIWRRVQMWPFLVTIPEKERDRYFRQKWLMPELPGILNRALAGLMSYHEQGLAPPPAIIEATEEYRKDMDVLGQWIAARLVPDPESRLKRTELFRDYEIWSKANIGWHLTSITFGRELAARKETLDLTEVWIDRERGWRGVALCSATATLSFSL